MNQKHGMRFGVDRLLSEKPALGRIGLVTNDVARTVDGIPSRKALLDAGFNIVRLFGPEHGLAAVGEDGAHIDDATDPLTGLPVVSLYGARTRPTDESLGDLDAVIFDIPDVGARFYTYIWTLLHVLEACGENHKKLVVLDRPNPLGGDRDAAEGPMLDEQFVSTFVGRWSMPIRHSLTVGELALLWNREREIRADVQVARMQHWNRTMHWPDTGLLFAQTSPAIRDYETALIYSGTCLIEGTNLCEGRGTDAPFRLIGAPWIDAPSLVVRLNELQLPGVKFEPARFTPTTRKYSGEPCNGVRIRITDARSIRPVSIGLHLILQTIRAHPDRFSWQPYPTAANKAGGGHFDRLAGIAIREQLEQGVDRIAEWTRVDRWKDRVTPILQYE